MGEARRRGSYEERLDEALERLGGDKFAVSKIKSATHFATVIDHSPDAKEVLDLTIRTFPEIKTQGHLDRFNENYQFLILVRGKKDSAKGILLARDMDILLNEAIPQVLARIAGVGGKCGFFLAVAPELIDQISPVVEGRDSASGA